MIGLIANSAAVGRLKFSITSLGHTFTKFPLMLLAGPRSLKNLNKHTCIFYYGKAPENNVFFMIMFLSLRLLKIDVVQSSLVNG